MYLKRLRPYQFKQAVASGYPLLVPAGGKDYGKPIGANAVRGAADEPQRRRLIFYTIRVSPTS